MRFCTGTAAIRKSVLRVELRVRSGEVRARVTDEGSGFDPDTVPDPRLPENIPRPDGRGIFLMRALMDEVHYNELGNSVTLVLREGTPRRPMTRDAASRPRLPESVGGMLEDFRAGFGLEIRAWHVVGGDLIPVFPAGASGPPLPAGVRFRVTPAGGPPLEVQVEAHGNADTVAEVLRAALERTCELAGRIATREGQLSERRDEIGLLFSISETLASVLDLQEGGTTHPRGGREGAGRREGIAVVCTARTTTCCVWPPRSGATMRANGSLSGTVLRSRRGRSGRPGP